MMSNKDKQGIFLKHLKTPDDTKEYDKCRIDKYDVGGVMVTRTVLQPGWTWSQNMKEHAHTDTCLCTHLRLQTSGTLRICFDNGGVQQTRAGDLVMITGGHCAQVEGSEPVEMVDFGGTRHWGKQQQQE